MNCPVHSFITTISIFLYHRYVEEKKKRNSRNEAMDRAIQNTFTSLFSSSLTTIEATPIEDREAIFNQIDKLEKEALDNYEKALDEVMPVAFSMSGYR